MPNKLIHASSPYLLQHANNPVHWQEWGDEALREAKELGKPMIVSIGYAACHWCHVMEHESFESEAIATLMNEHFVCIKVDREERPDIDQIYMEAVQAMGQNGGWPLNVFLTPDQKPFYGGTYFPAAAWQQVLRQIATAYTSRREAIFQSAEELTRHLQRNDFQRFGDQQGEITLAVANEMLATLDNRIDKIYGGLDKAPKFVMPTVWQWLLNYYSQTKNESALAWVELTLHHMTRGGLYDTVGGGFARYSVDGQWFAPHFEKMLYDNAQLLSLFSAAYAVTHHEHYRDVVKETVSWLEREMLDDSGGFYSALDADSEGVEGKFYAWTFEEFCQALGDDAPLFADYFQLTADGNWEHGLNILWQTEDVDDLLAKYSLDKNELTTRLASAKAKLFNAREHRQRPSLDDKIISGWNGMLITGLTDAYRAVGDEKFLQLAKRTMSFLETHAMVDGKLFRLVRGTRGAQEGFLEDYAFVIQAYVSLYETTFKERYLRQAEQWTNVVWENFYDEQERAFHFTSHRSEELIARKKELFDNVIPASNSVMTRNLLRLGILLDRADWKTFASDTVTRLASVISSEPVYMSNWGILFLELAAGMKEVVIAGPDAESFRRQLQQQFFPLVVYAGADKESSLPLLQHRLPANGGTAIYVCQNKVCKLPVNHPVDAIRQLTE